jgi:tetratricopeptide (TPR) repeat protein
MGVLTKLYEEPRNAASLTYVRTDSVLSYLEELWGTAERSVEYYREQMGYHLSERRPQVALAAAERAIALASGSPDEKAELGRARALRALGSADEALAALDAFIARVPRSAEAHVERAGCLHALGRNAEIGAAIDQALLGDPGDQLALSF